MRRALAAWVAFWATFALGNIIASKRGRSLCATNRWAWHMETSIGRSAFSATFWGGAWVLHRHVRKPFRKIREAL